MGHAKKPPTSTSSEWVGFSDQALASGRDFSTRTTSQPFFRYGPCICFRPLISTASPTSLPWSSKSSSASEVVVAVVLVEAGVAVVLVEAGV